MAGDFFYPQYVDNMVDKTQNIEIVLGNQMIDYSQKKWKSKSAHILRLDGYLDQYAKIYGKIMAANIVHHIYPAKEYPEYEWCDWNLISVSRESHNKLENRKTGKLTNAGEELKRRTKPGVNWRKR